MSYDRAVAIAALANLLCEHTDDALPWSTYMFVARALIGDIEGGKVPGVAVETEP